MMIAGTIFVLTSICVIALILRSRGVRLAYIWLLFFITAILIWLLLLLIRPENVNPFVIPNYFRSGSESINLVLKLDESNRVISFGLFSMLLSFLLSSTTNPQGDNSLYQWVEVVICAISCWVVFLAENSWTLLIAWTLMDFFDLIFHFRNERIKSENFLLYYLSKFVGSMILIFIVSLTYQVDPVGLFGRKINLLGLFTLVAVIFHAGFLFEISSGKSQDEIDSPAVFIRIAIFSANLYLLSRISNLGILPLLNAVLKILLMFFAVFFSAKWTTCRNEKTGLTYLLRAIAGITGYVYLLGNQTGIIYLLLILILPLYWLFLYSERDSKLSILWIIDLVIISGFPFSLTFLSLREFLINGRIVDSVLVTVPMAIIMAGFLKFVLIKKGKFNYLEQLIQGTYVFGLIIPLISSIAIATLFLPLSTVNLLYLWPGGVQISVFILLLLSKVHKKEKALKLFKFGGAAQRTEQSTHVIRIVLTGLSSIAGNVLHFTSVLFEGEGGILWSFILLSLLLTILASQGGIS